MFYKESENIKKLRKIVKSLNLKNINNEHMYEVFKYMQEHSKDGYWDWDITENEKFINPIIKSHITSKYENIENVDEFVQDVVVKEDLIKLFEELDKHFKSKGEYPFSVIIRCKDKENNLIKILFRGFVVEWEGDEPLRMIGSHVDVTNL